MKIDKSQKPAALVALYNASKPQGLGFFNEFSPHGGGLTLEEAAECLERCPFVDYLKGRVIKVDFEPDELDFHLYDRDVGEGAGARAVSSIC